MQIKIHNEQLKNITKIGKYEKLNSTLTTEHIAKHKYTLVNQTINLHKSNKRVTKEIEHISNNNKRRFKGRKTQDRKMNKQKIQLIMSKITVQNKTNNTKTKKILLKRRTNLTTIRFNVGQLSTSVLDLLKVLYNTRNDNKILKHSSTNIITIKQSAKHKQQSSTSKLHTKTFNENNRIARNYAETVPSAKFLHQTIR